MDQGCARSLEKHRHPVRKHMFGGGYDIVRTVDGEFPGCGSTWNQDGCWIQWRCSTHNDKFDLPQSGALIQERFLMVRLKGLPFVRQGISQPYDTVQVSTAVDFSEPFSCCNNGAAGRRWLHQLQHTKTTRVISYDVQQTNRTRSVCRCGTVAKVARNSLPSTCQTDDVH